MCKSARGLSKIFCRLCSSAVCGITACSVLYRFLHQHSLAKGGKYYYDSISKLVSSWKSLIAYFLTGNSKVGGRRAKDGDNWEKVGRRRDRKDDKGERKELSGD